MFPISTNRGLRNFATLLSFLAILILLLPQAANHHSVSLVFLLVPIFLFLERIDRPALYPPNKNSGIASNHQVRFTLFQRPPPSHI